MRDRGNPRVVAAIGLMAMSLACTQDHRAGSCDVHELQLDGEMSREGSDTEHARQAATAILSACPVGAFSSWQHRYLSELVSPDVRADVYVLSREELLGIYTTFCSDRGVSNLDASTPYTRRAMQVFEVCDLGRFDVLDLDEVTPEVGTLTWSFYPSLRKAGVDHSIARNLTRALLFRDRAGDSQN